MQENKQDKSPIKQRILQYLGKKGISMYDCYVKTGITRGVLGQNNGISEDNLTRFLAYYTDVNTEWLILGHGSMLRNEQDKSTSQLTVQSVSPVDESFLYKIYKDEKADWKEEKKELKNQIDLIQSELRQKSEELAALKVQYQQSQDNECDQSNSQITDSFIDKSFGDYGGDSLPMNQPTGSKISSVGKT